MTQEQITMVNEQINILNNCLQLISALAFMSNDFNQAQVLEMVSQAKEKGIQALNSVVQPFEA